MELGIFAKTFSRATLTETLDAVRDTGLATMQFNLALAGGPSLPDEISAQLVSYIHTEVSRRGLRMAAVSGTYNMAHPDSAVRADGQRRLHELIAAAAAGLGTGVVTLCTGSRDATDMWRRHPDNRTPEAWRDMLAGLEAALTAAEAHEVTLAFEPEHNNVVHSAAAGRRLLDAVRSRRLKVIIDPANLLDRNGLGRQGDTLREAFQLLGDDLVLAHAKDLRADGMIAAAGRGGLDYELYLALLGHAGHDVPLILHALAEDEVTDSVAFLRTTLARISTGLNAGRAESLPVVTGFSAPPLGE
jgi:sugar phosphate isomerase/epimerase